MRSSLHHEGGQLVRGHSRWTPSLLLHMSMVYLNSQGVHESVLPSPWRKFYLVAGGVVVWLILLLLLHLLLVWRPDCKVFGFVILLLLLLNLSCCLSPDSTFPRECSMIFIAVYAFWVVFGRAFFVYVAYIWAFTAFTLSLCGQSFIKCWYE